MCPRRDTALGHHAKRERPRRASVDWSLQKNEFATHLNLDLPNFMLPLKSVQTNLRQNWNAAYSDFKGRLWVPRTAPGIGRSMPRLSSRQIGESDASSCWCWSCCRPNATGDQSQKKHVRKASRNMCLSSSFANRVVMFFFVMVFVTGRPICKQITKLFDLTWTFPDISNARAIEDSQFDRYANTNVNVVYVLTHCGEVNYWDITESESMRENWTIQSLAKEIRDGLEHLKPILTLHNSYQRL